MSLSADRAFSAAETKAPVSSRPIPAITDAIPAFTGLTGSERSVVSSSGCQKTFSRGQLIHLSGDPVQRVLLITAGFIKISQLSSNGTEVILRLSAPGDLIGADGLLSNGLHSSTARCFRDCRVVSWDVRTFRNFLDQYPVLYRNTFKLLGGDLRDMENRFREVATEKIGQRVARQLSRLADTIGRRVAGGTEVGLSREELGQMTGTTPFTVSRLLSAWEVLGFVKPHRESVTILDVESLRNGCN